MQGIKGAGVSGMMLGDILASKPLADELTIGEPVPASNTAKSLLGELTLLSKKLAVSSGSMSCRSLFK